jgi:2-C-methyl-D-erythritol 4-phosphate cytidylyltransferase
MKDTAAIIVAGGMGKRFSADLPAGRQVRKQYLLLKGRPMVWWSLSAFEHSPSISSMVLVVPSDDVSTVRTRIRGWKFKKIYAVVAGGSTRAESVRRGLAAIPYASRYVAVHDAVRPLVQPALIERVITAARKTRAALAACPSQETIKLADARGVVISSPPRDRVWMAHTPQIFERGLLERAHREGRRQRVTDDAQLVEKLGVRVKLVLSSPENIKVTLPMDYVMARKIVEDRS